MRIRELSASPAKKLYRNLAETLSPFGAARGLS
jgi:hypothetical protein